MIVDSHQHFWQVGRFDYPWMSSDLGVLYRDYLPADLEPTLSANEVESTVLVQASNSVAESRWLLELAEDYPFIAGVVGWVDLSDPAIDQQLDELCRNPKFKGVRHLVEIEPDDQWLLRPDVLNGFDKLAARELTYDLLIHPRHLEFAERLVKEKSNLRFVIDHMAKPAIASEEFDFWSRELAPFRDLENVYCKMSGLVTEATRSSWTTDDLRRYVDYAMNVFGPSRLMFGSDHPVCLLAASYEQVLGSFQEILKDLSDSERERVFSKNALEFYSVSATMSDML